MNKIVGIYKLETRTFQRLYNVLGKLNLGKTTIYEVTCRESKTRTKL